MLGQKSWPAFCGPWFQCNFSFQAFAQYMDLFYEYFPKQLNGTWAVVYTTDQRSTRLILKEFRICHLKICHFGVLIILSWRYLKNNKCKERLPWTPLNCLDRAFKRNSIVINSLPHFISGEDWLLSQERRLDTIPGQTLSETIVSLIYSSKGLFIFPKNNLLFPKLPMFPLPFPL